MRWKIILSILAGVCLACFVGIIIVFSTYDYNKFKPQITGLVKKYTGRKLTMDGDIKVKLSLSPTFEVNNVSFQNAPWSPHPDMIRAERIEVQTALIPLIQGNISVKRLIILHPDVMIEIHKSGKTNLEFDLPNQKKVEAVPTKKDETETPFFDFKKVVIQDGKLTVKNHQKNTTFALFIDRGIEKSARFRSEAEIELQGSFNNIPLSLSGHLGSLTGITDPDVPFPMDLKAEVAQMEITIAGKIQDPVAVKGIDLSVSVKGDDLAKIESVTREPMPVEGPFQISGHLISANPKTIQASDIMIQLGDSKLGGSATLDLSANKPRIFGKMISETLDLRPMFKRSEKSAGGDKEKTKRSQKKSRKLFEDTPLKLDILNRIDADADVRIKQLLLPRFALDNIETKVKLKNGNLITDPLTADMGGGRLDSHLDVKAKDNVVYVDLKVEIKEMDIGEMFRKLEITQAVEGILDLDINFSGHGNSVAAIMADSNGKVVATLGQGKIPMGYLDYIGADIGSSFMELINPFDKKIDNARINCAVCDFHIKHGIAESKVIIIDDPQKTLFSRGTINLKTEALDFPIETKPKEGIGTKETGKLSISLSKITKPFKLGGTLTDPSLEIDIVNTATTIGAALLGPVGWAYLLVSGSQGNPCKKALEIVEKDIAGSSSNTEKQQKLKPESSETQRDLGDTILNFFKQRTLKGTENESGTDSR